MSNSGYQIRWIGLSTDQRTNKWKFTCPECGKIFDPPTTMLNKVDEKCPKCGYVEIVDYNSIIDAMNAMKPSNNTDNVKGVQTT